MKNEQNSPTHSAQVVHRMVQLIDALAEFSPVIQTAVAMHGTVSAYAGLWLETGFARDDVQEWLGDAECFSPEVAARLCVAGVQASEVSVVQELENVRGRAGTLASSGVITVAEAVRQAELVRAAREKDSLRERLAGRLKPVALTRPGQHRKATAEVTTAIITVLEELRVSPLPGQPAGSLLAEARSWDRLGFEPEDVRAWVGMAGCRDNGAAETLRAYAITPAMAARKIVYEGAFGKKEDTVAALLSNGSIGEHSARREIFEAAYGNQIAEIENVLIECERQWNIGPLFITRASDDSARCWIERGFDLEGVKQWAGIAKCADPEIAARLRREGVTAQEAAFPHKVGGPLAARETLVALFASERMTLGEVRSFVADLRGQSERAHAWAAAMEVRLKNDPNPYLPPTGSPEAETSARL